MVWVWLGLLWVRVNTCTQWVWVLVYSLPVSQTMTSELAGVAGSYHIPVHNIKMMLSPVLKPQNGGP